ncbi:MAG: DUF167 domain-containing protein [Campylobacterales bacterium]
MEIAIKVIPNAKKTEAVGVENDALKIRLSALPIEGRANEELVAFFSKNFKIAKSDVDIISGELGRNKRVRVPKNDKIVTFLKAIENE